MQKTAQKGEYKFTVRETLKRDRIYVITANSEDEARDLLDGFKQTPREETPEEEDIIVDDYDILFCTKSLPTEGDSVLTSSGIKGTLRKTLEGKPCLGKKWFVVTESNISIVEASKLVWDGQYNLWHIER